MDTSIEQNIDFTTNIEICNSDLTFAIEEIVKSGSKHKSESKSESESEPEVKTEVKTEIKSESEPEVKSEPIINPVMLISGPKYKNLVLSSGSVKGIAHIGAIQKLIDEGLLDLNKLDAIAGTSSGALAGLLINLGFSTYEIWKFLQTIDFNKMICPNISLLLTKCGVETGQIIYNVIEDILTKKTGIKHINFRQLYEITKIKYTVVGSCLTTKEAVYYNHILTPNFKVSVAVRISIGIPGIFTPVTIDDKKYIDGAVIDEYPIDLFKDELDKTIGIFICNEYNTKYEYPEQFFMAMINLFLHLCYKNNYNKCKSNTIYIKQDNTSAFDFDFNINLDKKKEIYQSGITAVEEFLTQNHITK